MSTISIYTGGGLFGREKVPAENVALCGTAKTPEQRAAAKEFLARKRSENAVVLGRAMRRQSEIAYGKHTN